MAADPLIAATVLCAGQSVIAYPGYVTGPTSTPTAIVTALLAIAIRHATLTIHAMTGLVVTQGGRRLLFPFVRAPIRSAYQALVILRVVIGVETLALDQAFFGL